MYLENDSICPEFVFWRRKREKIPPIYGRFSGNQLNRKGLYLAEEGCLSLQGQRRARRHRTIKVQWQDRQLQTHVRNFTGWTAQIIQHEIDHCSGILI